MTKRRQFSGKNQKEEAGLAVQLAALVRDPSFLVGEFVAFSLPLIITWAIQRQPPTIANFALALGFAIGFGLIAIYTLVKKLLSKVETHIISSLDLIQQYDDIANRLQTLQTIYSIGRTVHNTQQALETLDGPESIFMDDFKKEQEKFEKNLAGLRQKVIRVSFQDYAEKLSYLCKESSVSIDVVARSNVSTFWEYDWQETLESHKGKSVRRIFIFRRRSGIESYKLILRKHAETYGTQGIFITSEKALEGIQDMLGYTLDPGMDFGLFDSKVLSRLYADKAIITSIDTPAQYQQEREFEGFQKIFQKLVRRSISYALFCNSTLDVDDKRMDELCIKENINFEP